MITATDKPEAETTRREALNDSPPKPPASSDWNDRGVRLFHSGQADEAAECFKKAYQADPRNFGALENLIDLFIRSGKHDHPAAALSAQWWTRAQPRCARAWIASAKLSLLAGHLASAKTALAQALKIDPANSAALSAQESLASALMTPSGDALPESAYSRIGLSNARQTVERAMQAAQREGFPVGQWPGELAAACLEIWETRATTVLEIGVNHGGWIWVARNFCSRPLTYIGIDPAFTDRWPHCASMLAAEGVKVNAIKALSQSDAAHDAVVQALAGRRVDVLHIDGDHDKDATLNDFDLYTPLVRPGGLVLIHDIGRLKYLKKRFGSSEALHDILATDRAVRIVEVKTIVEQHFEAFDRHMGIAMLRIARPGVRA